MIVEVYTPYIIAQFDIPETHETIPLVLTLMTQENSHRQDYLSLHGYSWANSLKTLDTPLFPLSSTFHTITPHYVGDALYERAQLLEGVVYHFVDRPHMEYLTECMNKKIDDTYYQTWFPVRYSASRVLKDSPPVPWYGDVIRGMHS